MQTLCIKAAFPHILFKPPSKQETQGREKKERRRKNTYIAQFISGQCTQPSKVHLCAPYSDNAAAADRAAACSPTQVCCWVSWALPFITPCSKPEPEVTSPEVPGSSQPLFVIQFLCSFVFIYVGLSYVFYWLFLPWCMSGTPLHTQHSCLHCVWINLWVVRIQMCSFHYIYLLVNIIYIMNIYIRVYSQPPENAFFSYFVLKAF